MASAVYLPRDFQGKAGREENSSAELEMFRLKLKCLYV